MLAVYLGVMLRVKVKSTTAAASYMYEIVLALLACSMLI